MGEFDSLFVNDIVQIDKWKAEPMTLKLDVDYIPQYGILVEMPDKDTVVVDILDSRLVMMRPVNIVNSKIGTLIIEKPVGYKTEFTRNRLSLKVYRVRSVGDIRDLLELADAERG